ncbi:MAG: DnaT-like ssDNA-binding domain-containing protein, partial [Aeromonas sp.]
MTPAEYSALADPTLSHPARSLYTLHLRKLVQEHQL